VLLVGTVVSWFLWYLHHPNLIYANAGARQKLFTPIIYVPNYFKSKIDTFVQ